jgi:hypothetical protein
LYPGIDLVWHARHYQIEHDFVLAAGANPRSIRLAFQGVSPEINRDGDLLAGPLRLHKPRAYQDGREIACHYELRPRAIGFALGEYDRARPLTIDPVLDFSTLLGGSGADGARSVAVDGAGNIYVAGFTASADFPTTPNAFQTVHTTSQCSSPGTVTLTLCPNVFVTKFTADGSTLVFSTFLTPSSLAGMAIDKSGNVYLASETGIIKLSADGSSLIFTKGLPISPSDSISGLAVDGAGAVYVTGSTHGGLQVVNAFQSAINQPPVFKTTDSAVHWQGFGDGLPSDLVDSIAVDPTNPQVLYLGMDHGLYKSTDGGMHWLALLQGSPSQFLTPTSITVDPMHSQTLYVIMNGIIKSTDGGATWSPAGAGADRSARMIAIDPSNTATLYAAADTGLYKSTDGAATWSLTGLIAPPVTPATIDPFFVHNVVIDPSTPSTVYAGTANGVMKSLDGGATWTLLTNGFSQSVDVRFLVIDPVKPQTLYAATNINFAPYRTSDGGAHWAQGQWPGGFTYVLSLLVDPLVP